MIPSFALQNLEVILPPESLEILLSEAIEQKKFSDVIFLFEKRFIPSLLHIISHKVPQVWDKEISERLGLLFKTKNLGNEDLNLDVSYTTLPTINENFIEFYFDADFLERRNKKLSWY